MSHYEISPREREDEDRRWEREHGSEEAEKDQDRFDERHLNEPGPQDMPGTWS